MTWQYFQFQNLASQRRDDLLREADRDRLAALLRTAPQADEPARPTVVAADKHGDVIIWRPRLAPQVC